MTRSVSITRRLILTVLLLELSSAIALVSAITVHERHVQWKAFDANLQGTTDSLMGAVQDAEDEGDNVMLDLRGVQLDREAIFRVEDERGRILGSAGQVPPLQKVPSNSRFQNAKAAGKTFRFYTLHGLRIVDPGKPNGGVRHDITIVYGTPVAHVWHEVLEAIRFFAVATASLLGITALLMVWLIRKGLKPIHHLAHEAEKISSTDWQFCAPASARETEELRPLSAALEAALARLERSFKQQRRFTSDAAHELKTDVAIVKSSLQLLSMRKRTAEEYRRGLALSLDDFTRLEITVQKMLTLARLEQPLEGLEQTCCLRDVVEDAVHQSSPFAELKSVELITRFPVNPIVPVDSRDALLLCSNIILNALQHTPDGAIIQVELTAENGQVRLTVKDQGEGISEEDRPFLFEPFYRGDASRSRKSGGTGLGLSICKAICDRVGGTIEIANRPEGGAVVSVILPGTAVRQTSALSASIKA